MKIHIDGECETSAVSVLRHSDKTITTTITIVEDVSKILANENHPLRVPDITHTRTRDVSCPASTIKLDAAASC